MAVGPLGGGLQGQIHMLGWPIGAFFFGGRGYVRSLQQAECTNAHKRFIDVMIPYVLYASARMDMLI
jgi:hypothetical protein